METIRTIIAYKDYFRDFLRSLSPKIRQKVSNIFDIIETVEIVPSRHLRHIEGTDGLYEIRVQFGSDILRVFCFFDTGKLVILLTGFIKKTQKTPKREIDRAVRLMKEYYKEKEEEICRQQHGMN